MISEDLLEKTCVAWFEQSGYDYACGYDIAPDGNSPERSNYHQIILHDRLLNQLKIINPNIPLATLEQVAHQLAKPETPILIKNNQTFHRSLLEGVKVEFKDKSGDTKVDHVRLVDFDTASNNQFLVVNQFTMIGSKGNRRPDVIVFINGLPFAVIELKNPADNNADIWSAYQQLQTYKEEIPDLFIFNEALVVSDGLNARVGVSSEHMAIQSPILEQQNIEHSVVEYYDRPMIKVNSGVIVDFSDEENDDGFRELIGIRYWSHNQ